MNLKDFITKYNGKFIDWDGHYSAQCVDLYRQYVNDVWKRPQTPPVKSAFQILDTLDLTQYDKFTSGKIEVGDVIIWNNKFGPDGHVAIIENPIDPKSIVVFGQNDPLGSVSKLSRYNYANIKGWFRPKNPLAKTFMAVTVVANNNNWTTLEAKLESTKQRSLLYSDNKFEPVFNIVKTNFDNIPLAPPIPIEGYPKSVDINWYRKNITPLTKGQATILLLNPDQYQTGPWGYMTWGDPQRPIRIELASLEDNVNFEDQIIHELEGHGFAFLTGQPDITHQLTDQAKYKELLGYVDHLKLQKALINIK